MPCLKRSGKENREVQAPKERILRNRQALTELERWFIEQTDSRRGILRRENGCRACPNGIGWNSLLLGPILSSQNLLRYVLKQSRLLCQPMPYEAEV